MSSTRALRILGVLSLLFLFRVLAQLIQVNNDAGFLPGFDAWHSSTIPYGWLLFSQILILALMLQVGWNIHRGQYRFRSGRARVILVIGSIYFVLMLVRLVLGLTILPEHHWFGALLPAVFHLVLAAYLLVLGAYELANAGDKCR